MTHLLKMSRGKLYAGLAFFGALILAITLILTNTNLSMALLPGRAQQTDYSILLDNTNSVSAAGDVVQHTKKGSNVTFTYKNVAAYNGGHTKINAGGSIVNKQQITSVTEITAQFSAGDGGSLRFRTSYDGATWGGYAQMTSGETYELGSQPYYIEFSASDNYVNVDSIQYYFSCVANPSADSHTVVEEEKWQLVKSTNELTSGMQVLIVGKCDSNYYVLQNAYATTSQYWYYLYGQSITITGETASATSEHTIWTLSNGSANGKYTFTNGSDYLWGGYSNSHYNIAKESKSGFVADWSISISNSVATLSTYASSYTTYLSLKYYSNGDLYEFMGNSTNDKEIYLYKHVDGSSHEEWDTPVDLVSITTAFNNNLNEDSIFDNVGSVVVTGHYSDGSQQVLNSGYTTKVVLTSTDKEIDTSKPFGYDSRPGGMDYTLVVEYGTLLPVRYNFTVGQNIYVTDVESTFDTGESTLNTANTLNEFINNYSVTLTLRRGNPISGITYATFSNYSEYGLSLALLDPNGVSHSLSAAFGTPGTWTLRTSTTKNSCVDESTFEVYAIPVTEISVTGTLSVEEGKTTQLSAGVVPANATNNAIEWSSSNESIATVSSTGLVTGVGTGSATITASATDGSGVVGSVTVTVTERTSSDYELLTSASDLKVGSKVIIAESQNSKAMSTTQSSNNRPATVVTISNNKISETGLPAAVQVFEVKEGTTSGTFAFYDSDANGYIYAASGSKNYLRTQSTNDANSSFTVTLDSSYNATIVGQGTNTNSTIRYNPNGSSPIFSCYGSTSSVGSLPKLYVSSGVKVYPTSITLTGSSSVSVNSTITLGVEYNPAGTNVKNVSWRSSDTTVATVSNGVVTGVKAGTATIYAKAQTKTGYTTEVSKTITVSNVAVTGVSLDKSSGTINVDGSVTLTPTISPSNATNKNVTWSTSNSSVATVTNGVVTGVSAGTATITVTTVDGSHTATYAVTVVTSGGGSGGSGSTEWNLVTDGSTLVAGDVIVIANYSVGAVAGSISSQILSSVTSDVTFSTSSTITELPDTALQLTLGGQEGAWTLSNSDGQKLGATAVKKLAWDSGTTTWDISISSNGATIQNGTSSYGRFLYNTTNPRFTTYTSDTSSTMLLPDIYIGGSAEPVDPTGISLDPSSLSLSAGQSKSITATITPKGANQNKTITWSTSNSAVATVDNTGKVSVQSTATSGQTATITAKLNDAPTKPQATATVTVSEQQNDRWTILVYMCGSNLESDNGFATGDIQEMLNLRNSQPDDMNIVIQTGGSKKWKKYSIPNNKIGHYVLEPGKTTPTQVELLEQANMGNSNTLTSFIEWGVSNYPADKIGLIFWNHGGALDGCCWDDNYGSNGDPLTQSERLTGIKTAYNNLNRTEPFEWVGYDCCLMAVQDIAEFDSPYFNYSVASQESESGYGWDYDSWIDDMYDGKSTEVILKAIVDSFIEEQGTSSDQTLSVLNLQNMAAYKSAWETMASSLSSTYITSQSKWTTMKGYVNTAHKYGYDSDYDTSANNNGYVYDIFNVSEVLSKFKTNYSNCSSQITAAQTALDNLVVYNSCGTQAGNSCGVCCFFPISQYGTSSYYSTSVTHFTQWRSLCFKYS